MTIEVLQRVFGHRRYSLAAIVVAFSVLSATLLFPNREVLEQVLFSNTVGIGVKISFLLSLYGSLVTNFSWLSIFYLLTIAVLFGINLTLLIYYVRRRQIGVSEKKAHITSIAGLVSGLLGVGCAACGSIILTSILGLFGAGSLLLWLPFHGTEFGIIGIVLLGVSIRYLIKRIDDPLVCAVNSRTSSVKST